MKLPTLPFLRSKSDSDHSADSGQPRVVIIGGGFGGIYAARALKDAPVRVTLIDRQNYHLFQPLLYQVATGALSPADIASPIRSILRKQRNAATLLAEAADFDLDRQEVLLTDGERIPYDYLIVATGSRDNYFGHDEWHTLAPGLKDLDDAVAIRQQIFSAFEEAERETDPERRTALLTFLVVGGGPTGVELAGALGEIARQTLAEEFRSIDPSQSRIILLDGADRILRTYTPRLSASAERQLARLGVETRLDRIVTAVSPEGVTLQTGEQIRAETVLWSAGVIASPLGQTLGAERDRSGRVLVNPDLTLPVHSNVYVIGDLAAITGKGGQALPGVAQVAIQSGRWAGENIARSVKGEERTPFVYKDLGSMATIGRNAAVAEIGPFKLSGFLAWLTWVFIHIAWLIGFRNRLFVLIQWAWAYLTHGRSVRLITTRSDSLIRTSPAREDGVQRVA
jgi:NADH dehydrogenase